MIRECIVIAKERKGKDQDNNDNNKRRIIH